LSVCVIAVEGDT